jgi:hypothetical protein
MKPTDFKYGEVWLMTGSGPDTHVMFVLPDLDERSKSKTALMAREEDWITAIRLDGSNAYEPEGIYIPWHAWEKMP